MASLCVFTLSSRLYDSWALSLTLQKKSAQNSIGLWRVSTNVQAQFIVTSMGNETHEPHSEDVHRLGMSNHAHVRLRHACRGNTYIHLFALDLLVLGAGMAIIDSGVVAWLIDHRMKLQTNGYARFVGKRDVKPMPRLNPYRQGMTSTPLELNSTTSGFVFANTLVAGLIFYSLHGSTFVRTEQLLKQITSLEYKTGH